MPGSKARKMMVFEAVETHIRPKSTEPLGDVKKLNDKYILPQKE